MELKKCKACGVDKATSEFYESPHTADGLYVACKACHVSAVKTRRAERIASGAPVKVHPNGRKRCSKCRIEKHVSEFHKQAGQSDGLNCACKACKKAYATASSEA